MTKLDRKTAIQKTLMAHPKGLSLSGIISELGDEYKERTVRRLLAELVAEGAIQQHKHGRNTYYQPISQQTTAEESLPNTLFSPESQKAIERIRHPLFERSPINYQHAWLESYIPNKTYYFSDSQRQQMMEMGHRTQKIGAEPAGTYSRKILNRLLIDLSYNSSRLEGNTYSQLDTEKLIIDGISLLDKLDEERVMILNHKDAIEFLVRNAGELEVSYQEVCTLHYLLADGLLQTQHLGKVRSEAVRISHSTYSPMENAQQLEQTLNNILNKATEIQNPYEQSLFLLVHISYLQPFMDVNKRTSRLSANIPMIRENLVPLSFNDLDKNDYLSAILAAYEFNEIAPLADLYCASYLRSCLSYDVTVEALGFDPIRVKYRQQRRSVISTILRECWTGKDIETCIIKAYSEIDEPDQKLFKESIEEELNTLNEAAIAGLGVSRQELETWKELTTLNPTQPL